MNERKFTYNRQFYVLGIPLVMLAVCLLVLPVEVIMMVKKLFSSELPINSENVAGLLISIIVPIYFSQFFPRHLNIFPFFKISDKGLNVRIFNFWFIWKFIPWDRIIEIKKTSYQYMSKDLWEISIDKDLSFWHKKLNQQYGKRDTSSIYFTAHLKDLNEFVSRVVRETEN